MRHLCVFLCTILIFSLVLCGIPHAFAEEQPTEPAIDYANYDWGNLNFKEMDYRTWEPMCNWLSKNADLSLLIVVQQQTDGSTSTDLAGIFYDRFIADPEAVMYALLAAEEETSRGLPYLWIVTESDDRDDLIKALESVSLSGSYAEKGYERLTEMIAYAEELYRTEITNPKTGDPVGVAAVLLTVSGIGIALLVTKKKLL